MLKETWALTVREMKHWYRVKIQMFMTVIQPVIWLGLFGQAFNLSGMITQFLPPGSGGQSAALFGDFFAGAPNYFSYMAIGMLAVIVLFTCMFSGMSIVWDRRFGFLTKLRLAPIPREAIPLSRILASVMKAMFQVSLVFIIALVFTVVPGLTGLSLSSQFNVMDLIGLFITMMILAFGFSALFTTIALAVENQETLFAVINLLNLPLMMASAALFPLLLMPEWLRAIASVNPITLAVDAARQFAFHTASPINPMWLDILGLAIFSTVMVGLSFLVSRKLLAKG